MNNSRNNTRRQSWITTYRVVTLVLLVALLVVSGIQLFRPAPQVPATAEIAAAINGPAKFQRPSAMEYVAKTDSCVVGGTVMSAKWHVGPDTFDVAEVDDLSTVDYTSYKFRSDEGRVFTVSANDALFMSSGENLGLELFCDRATMDSAPSFGQRSIIWGGK